MSLKSSLLIFASLFLLPSALATTFIERPFPESVSEAPLIVRGRIGTSYADWVQNAGGRKIYTFYDLQVDEVIKGQVENRSIVIRELGGEKDGVGMHVSGAAQFDRGEDVVVFLTERNSDGSFDVLGLMMAKYNIQRDESGNEVLVGPGLGGAHSHAAESSHKEAHDESHNAPEEPKKWTLDALRQLVKEQQSQNQNEASTGNSGTSLQQKQNRQDSDAGAHSGADAALRLQPASDQESQGSRPFGVLTVFGIALVGVGVFAAFRILRRRS